MAEKNSLIRSPVVLIGVVVVVIAAAAAGGYFLGTDHSMGPGTTTSSTASGTTASTAVPAGVCGATLARVRAFGITTPTATLTSTDATKTDTPNRVTCSVKDGSTTYTVAVDQLCDDMSKNACLQLYKVTDSTGAVDFQRTHFLKPTP